MSYILDALRRADAERERDPARGIHAQPAAGAPVPAPRRVPGWAWPAGALAIVAVAGAIAWDRPGSAPIAVVAAPKAAAAPEPAPTPAPVPPVPPVPPVMNVAAAVSPPAPAPLPAPVERPRPATASQRVEAVTPAVAAASAPAVVATAAPAAVLKAPAGERVFNVTELPADVQRELPKLTISGGVHSENAAQRLLVVGGQVVNEGAELAPGVVLEQIRARTAVLRYRGYRYSVGY